MLLLQVIEELEHLGAHGDIEGGDRLVGDDEARTAHDGAGNGDTLTLAARELVGITLGKTVLQPDLGQDLGDAGLLLRRAHCLDQSQRFAHELLAPTGLLSAPTLTELRTVQYPGLRGVLPGFGTKDPNDWGLGFEIRGTKSPHWTGTGNSPATYGHFGRSGTMLWIDPEARLALVALTDRDFGPWAAEAWPVLADAVLSS